MYCIIYFQSYISIMMRLLSIFVFITISDWSHGRFNSLFCANKACKSHKAPMALARHRNILTAYKKTIIRSFLCHLTAKSITDTEKQPLIRHAVSNILQIFRLFAIQSKNDILIFVGGLLQREKVVLDKKDAFNFFGLLKDNINHECYEEGCTFGEVVDHYGHSEKSVGLVSSFQFILRQITKATGLIILPNRTPVMRFSVGSSLVQFSFFFFFFFMSSVVFTFNFSVEAVEFCFTDIATVFSTVKTGFTFQTVELSVIWIKNFVVRALG